MPKDGKNPLSPDEVAVIGWWIEAGAPEKGTIGELDVPQPIRLRIGRILGL
jgi:hypothetical protein